MVQSLAPLVATCATWMYLCIGLEEFFAPLRNPLLKHNKSDLQWRCLKFNVSWAAVWCGSLSRDTVDGSAWYNLPLPQLLCPAVPARSRWDCAGGRPLLPGSMPREGGGSCQAMCSEASLLLWGSRLVNQQRKLPLNHRQETPKATYLLTDVAFSRRQPKSIFVFTWFCHPHLQS